MHYGKSRLFAIPVLARWLQRGGVARVRPRGMLPRVRPVAQCRSDAGSSLMRDRIRGPGRSGGPTGGRPRRVLSRPPRSGR
jgi:hypothetical protein